MTLTAQQLFEVASRYRDTTKEYYLRQEASPQHERLAALWQQELLKMERWRAFLRALEQELPGFTFGDGTAPLSPCFRCIAYPASSYPHPEVRWAVVGCVSILAPVYSLYGVEFEFEGRVRKSATVRFVPLPPHLAAVASVIATRLEAEFGVTELPPAFARTPVPLFVESKEPPETTLFDALFTDRPEIIP
ncbi:hypothetical protein HPC49_48275 [Pyxidicoccus fallax]|uniref:Uncharacterized protein n=1 Tax=Pyxidicoccus fallax TaxID=394095 RepID=A0A848LPI4_9BACT|nr:hypothetical protein [Pyxidicoccus fallax]NMO19493.1 hypothetical protein [Pyxidicoccus fallax]NPC85969.1 hypothetical protein [Pyxidicoccus fallax]